MLLPNWLISTFTNYLIYTNFKISWLGRLCRVALLYCCRSDSPQYNALPLSQLIHALGCRECTLMRISVINNFTPASTTNGSVTPTLNKNNNEKDYFMDVMLYQHSNFTSSSRDKHKYPECQCRTGYRKYKQRNIDSTNDYCTENSYRNSRRRLACI